MRLLRLLPCFLALVSTGAQKPPDQGSVSSGGQGQTDESHDMRLPNGKLQSEAVMLAEYQKSLVDCRDLVKLAEDLKIEMEKNTQNVLSISAIKKTEEIEKIAKRIRSRMKH